MNTTVRKRFKTAVLASAALMAATVIAPQQAKADATLAAILGGSALLGLILHANQPLSAPGYPTANAPFTHPRYNAPAPQRAVAMQSYPSYAPVVYASVAPVAMYPTPYRVTQPVNYQVTAPTAMPHHRSVYHSSSNMSYPGAPVMQQQPMQHSMQQRSLQQAMIDPMQQPAQAQQMSYRQPQYSMGAAQPQYGTTYPQY